MLSNLGRWSASSTLSVPLPHPLPSLDGMLIEPRASIVVPPLETAFPAPVALLNYVSLIASRPRQIRLSPPT